MRPRDRSRLTFDQYLDRRLDDARYMHGVVQKLWTIFDLNLAAIQLSEDIEEVGPDFWKQTTLAPQVDRVDPLKFQQKLDEAPP